MVELHSIVAHPWNMLESFPSPEDLRGVGDVCSIDLVPGWQLELGYAIEFGICVSSDVSQSVSQSCLSIYSYSYNIKRLFKVPFYILVSMRFGSFLFKSFPN
jgi:hypothetical protein